MKHIEKKIQITILNTEKKKLMKYFKNCQKVIRSIL